MLAGDDERGERRGARRMPAGRAVRLRSADLILEGTLVDVSAGGAFVATQLLIEVGERGRLMLDELEVGVRVVWLRGNAHVDGPGMGLAFAKGDPGLPALLARLGVT